jgi:predicted RNA binding protein YcfA (HicA-like mRNA interferase family)
MPRKIRQLIADLEGAGFTPVSGGKGSHCKFRHPQIRTAIREVTR